MSRFNQVAMSVRPTESESIEAFTVRAHQALIDHVPDPDERNQMVWSAWDESRGKLPAEERAANTFTGDKFISKPKVCLFLEHSTTKANGDPITYTVNDLAEIVQSGNSRASDRKAFAALTDNHTNLNDQSHEGDPPVLGHIGSYRLGMAGYDEPVFAIYGDEYHYTSEAALLERKPRRSVELITFHSTGERFIDPVACLGGRAPRLPLPTQYSVGSMVDSNGKTHSIERYTASVPGAANTFIPGDGGIKPKPPGHCPSLKSNDREIEFFQTDESEEPNMALSDQDIAQITQAISRMPEFEYVRNQMEQEDQAGDEMMAEPEAGLPGLDAPDAAPAGPELGEDEQFAAAPVTAPEEDGAYNDQMYGDEEQYSLSGAAPTVEQYNALQMEHIQNMRKIDSENSKLRKRLDGMEREKVDASRKETLRGVVEQYAGVFDLDEEVQRFSASSVSDQQFAKEVQRMHTIGGRANKAKLQNVRIPAHRVAPESGVEVSQNSAIYDAAVEIQTEAANQKKFISYTDLMTQARERVKK